ncbi:MAG: bifunctional 3-(3-hydroxy-phenyl)propionate/3-hydroxycinnamic acid hydroxylase [Pseudomonadales bacterium]
MARPRFDVAVVGMGPVGAGVALFLAHQGLSVAVFDKAADVYELPRAVALDGEIVRAFQGIGLGDALTQVLQAVRPGERAGFTNSRREWLFGQQLVPFGRNGWQPVSMFDQPELERFMRGRLAGYPNCYVFLAEEVLETRQSPDEVTLTTTRQVIDADWLIACDGAASPIRKALDIGWQDLGYDHDWLVVDVTLNPGATLKPETLQVCDPGRLVTYVGTKEPFRRWEFKLNPGETAQDLLKDDVIGRLIDPWLPRQAYRLRRKAVYQFHAATADRWREGRIFIAGDAAHQTPPFLGQGLNAGMRDAANLAWKLALVQRGVCGSGLLDSYQAERMPHAQDLVEWAVSLGQLMEHLAAAEAAGQRGEAPPVLPARKQASGYGQGREAPPLRDGVLMRDQVSDEGSTGYLFCQPIVSSTTQTPVRLDELLGPGFSLVTSGDLPVLSDASRSIMARLEMRHFTLAGLTPEQGRFDPLFEQADVAIVRPDRYVFGHTTAETTADDLLGALAARLSLN